MATYYKRIETAGVLLDMTVKSIYGPQRLVKDAVIPELIWQYRFSRELLILI